MTDVTPAMTAEEWARHCSDAVYQFPLETRLSWAGSEVGQGGDVSRHALAALALHGQAFGFRHAHLRALREVLDEVDFDGPDLKYWAGAERADLVREAAAIIAALLPPEGTP